MQSPRPAHDVCAKLNAMTSPTSASPTNSADRIVIRPMEPGRDSEFAEMLEEFRAAGETDVYKGHQSIAWQGYAAYYELLSKMKLGGYPTPDIVPMDSYFIEVNNRIAGELFIRRRLSPRLRNIGGHVGYKVRPSCRNKGVATAALRLALLKLRGLGIERALITCNATNGASARVIQKCGGVRTNDAQLEGHVEQRYWIDTGRICPDPPLNENPVTPDRLRVSN
jgi:predicted acetyltransferase